MAEANILGAALSLFAKKGFEGTSIRDIASDAGVRAATIYHYIDTKEDLLLMIMERGLGSLSQSAREALRSLKAPEKKLAALVKMHVAIQGSYQRSALVIDAEYLSLGRENRVRVKELRDEYESHWRCALEEGVSSGVFGIHDPKLATFALLEMCNGVARWYRSDGLLPLEVVEDEFVDMALSMVSAEREGRTVRMADLNLSEPVIYASGFLEQLEKGRQEVEA